MSQRLWGPLVAVAVVFVPSAARGQIAAGVDAGALLDDRASSPGLGLKARFGYRTALTRGSPFHLFIFQPEAIAGYGRLGLSTSSSPEAQIGFAGGGLRLGGLTGRVEPFVYFHASYAFGTGGSRMLADGGCALDLRLPSASIGLHFSYDWLLPEGNARSWFELGPHFEVRWF